MYKSLIGKSRICAPVWHMLAVLFSFLLVQNISAQQINDDILLVVDNREITTAEFLHHWGKSDFYPDPGMMEEYLELFIDFQLKVAHAREEGIHREASVRNALAQYRRNLAAPYLGDPDMEEKLAREAYGRLLYDVNASHILVRLAPGYSPDDTLMAWDKAMQIRQSLLDGEPFEIVARATSDDPSAKLNSGHLGYFTALQMLYPFENAVFAAEPGEIGMPVRSRSGYHIIRVNEKRKSSGEIKAAHIMIGYNHYDIQEAEKKARDIYKSLLAGQSFEDLAIEHSTDFNNAGHGGILDWFGAGRFIPEFETAAFALQKPGDISEPVRTSYGWHIIKLIDQREIPPFDQVRKQLLDRIREQGGSRYALIRNALVERLMKEWGFSEDPRAFDIFYHIVDERVFEGTWTVPENMPLDRVIFSVTGKKVTQRDFAEFISENSYRSKPWSIDEYLYLLYRDFVDNWLVELEEGNLENKYPEFRLMINQYTDGMLLYEISQREVWSPVRDSAGVAEFYKRRIDDYMWDRRISATVYTISDSRLAARTARRARRSVRFSSRDDNWVVDRLNRSSREDRVTFERGLYTAGDKDIFGIIPWEEGASDILSVNDTYKVVLIHEILDPEPKSQEEAGEQIIKDYQEYLEDRWITMLREKYHIKVNREVLSTIN